MRRLVAWWRWRRELAAAERDVRDAWVRMVNERAAGAYGWPLDRMREWNRLAGYAQDLRRQGPR